MAEHAVCVSASFIRGSEKKTLISKRITKVSTKLSLADILDEQLGDVDIDKDVNEALNKGDELSCCISVRETDPNPFSMDCTSSLETALEFDKSFRFLSFTLNVAQSTSAPDINNNCQKNAFDLLMQADTCTQHVASLEEKHAKDRLFNTLAKHLNGNNCLFPASMASADVKKHVMTIVNALWYLDGNTHKIIERNLHQPEKVKPIPDRFLREDLTGFNDWKKKRKHAPTLSADMLRYHSSSLFSIVGLKFTTSWGELRSDIESLAVSLNSFAAYLTEKNEEQTKRQKLFSAPRQVGKDSYLEIREATNHLDPTYATLDQSIRKLENYEYLLFNEEFHAPNAMNSSERFRFLENLSLTVPTCMLTYCPGGNLGKICYIWKVAGETTTNGVLSRSLPIYEKLKEHLPEFHTRQMRKDFVQRYSRLHACVVPKHILRSIYADLTVDASALQNPSVDGRVQVALEAGDPDLVLDLRHLNTGRPEDTFSVFFEALNKKIEDQTAVDERRHGVCHMSQYISVPDLISQVSKEVPEGTPVPSESTVLYSFVPKDSHKKTAKLYTSKVPLQFKVQTRQLRVSHPDEHYCSAIFKYLKTYAVTYSNDSVLLCVDDKCKVDFGEPGQAVQTGVRGKKAIVPTHTQLSCLDHDQQSKGSITPSVCLKIEVPNEIDESFYKGEVCVTYKDSVFEASTPFRHAVETEKIIRKKPLKPVLILYSDGGPDHRLTYHSVKLSLIILFKRLGVDTLIAARTAPGHSWVNPAERIMSVLNLALQNCALSREECNSQFEQNLKSANSMSEIRSKATKVAGLKNAWMDSVQPIKELLESRTTRLSLKGTPFTVQKAAGEDEVNLLEKSVQQCVDPSIEEGKYQQQHLKSKQAYQQYLQDHCRQRHYIFQIRKCSNPTCCVPCMSETVFPWLPDPMLKENDPNHYKSFSDLVGTDTTDSRPSANVMKPKELAEQLQGVRNDGLVAQNVRKVVQCYECLKPRCIYSRKSLTMRDSRALGRLMEKHDYCCGAQIVPDGDALSGKVTVRLQMCCETHIEFAYYASHLGRGDVCCYCGSNGSERDKGLLEKYRVVLPVCAGCLAQKRPIPKRNPIK